MGKIIWIEGIVGIGKSTLAHAMEMNNDFIIYMREPVNENEYLQLFYEDMATYSFPMQMYLLYKRFQQHYEAQNTNGIFVFDRGISGDKVFADMLHADGFISDLDYKTYIETHEIMLKVLKKPDHIIYLDGSPEWAYERLRKRDRIQEATVPLEYLQNMATYYHKIFLSNNKDDFVRGVEINRIKWTDGMDKSFISSDAQLNLFKSLGVM